MGFSPLGPTSMIHNGKPFDKRGGWRTRAILVLCGQPSRSFYTKFALQLPLHGWPWLSLEKSAICHGCWERTPVSVDSRGAGIWKGVSSVVVSVGMKHWRTCFLTKLLQQPNNHLGEDSRRSPSCDQVIPRSDRGVSYNKIHCFHLQANRSRVCCVCSLCPHGGDHFTAGLHHVGKIF